MSMLGESRAAGAGTDEARAARSRPAPAGTPLPDAAPPRPVRRHPARLALALAIALPTFATAQAPPAPPPVLERAAPGRPGWLVDARTGCWVWNGDPRPSDSVAWSGGCGPDGRATGRGVEEWRDGDKVSRYEGEVQDGKAQGRGVYTFANG